ncbi:MAG: ParB/RepB/Spo0J family partition protein [Gallionella sp.]|jgi:ParB family chromosome partitioning protein
MAFKEAHTQFQMLDVTSIAPDPASPRKKIDEAALNSLANSIAKVGVIHPLVVQAADPAGQYTLIVGERRWRAAVLAGEKTVPVLIRSCEAAEVLDVQVAENMGLGVRSALEPRDMARALQTIAERFDNREAAAEHLGGTKAWLNVATAAANLSPKITALLDSGKIASAGTAIQLEKLSRKHEAKAESLIDSVEQLPEGEKLTRKAVDRALSEAGGRRKPEQVQPDYAAAYGEEVSADSSINRSWISPGKVKRVAQLLGLPDGDEAEVLTRLVDEFLALREEVNPSF